MRRSGVRRQLVLGLVTIFLTSASAFAGQLTIGFRDLPDPAAQGFEDPFRQMGSKMLNDLRTVVRIEQQLEKVDVSGEARLQLETELRQARVKLSYAGHDADALLAQRLVVADARKRALFATNPDLHQATVTISGFLIPAGSGGNGRRVGYLVPELGMCSHTPPPPPNQLVRVTFDTHILAKSLYVPVTVSGVLETVERNERIFVADGEVPMVSMWNLDATDVTVLASAGDTAAVNPWRASLMAKYKRAVTEQQPDNK